MPPAENPTIGEATPIPDVSAPDGRLGSKVSGELQQFEKDGVQSHLIRRWAAYGGLFCAAILYVAGLYSVGLFLGVWPSTPKVCDVCTENWHIVVAVLFVLFSVPTVLVIAVLKMINPTTKAELPTTAHEAMGRLVEKAIEKLIG
jgi:hypothetical protein